MRRFNLSEWAVTHRPVVLFAIVCTLLIGLVSYAQLGRSEDPGFNVPTMTAVVAWPGATARQMQDQVLNRIERELQQIEGIDHVRTYARQGYGGIYLWMQGGTSQAGLERAWYLARKKIADAWGELPDGVHGPYFDDELTDVHGVLLAFGAPELRWSELARLVEQARRELQSVPGVHKVELIGKQDEKVHVEFSTAKLAALGIGPQTLIDALARQNGLAPSGSHDGRNDRVHVRVDGGLGSARDVAALPIESGGRLLRLSDVAQVRAGIEDPPQYRVRHDGQAVLMLGVVFNRSGNVLEAGRALDARLAALEAALPVGVTLQKVADQPEVVRASVWEFERAFLEALAIVLAVCFLFLGWRCGLVVAASVPLVLAAVAGVMLAMGWQLDRISLGALIIALGLLVDDAIIAVEMMAVRIEQGFDRVRAATFAYASTAFPMLTGTLVTAAGFMPVGFAKSISGEYAGGIFWIVGIALIASWFVAVIFTPYLGLLLLPERPEKLRIDLYDRPAYGQLRRALGWCVRHRGAVIGLTLAALLLSLAGLGQVQHQFFPTASRLELIVDLRMREGASFQATELQVRRFEQVLADDPQVQQHSSYIGAGAPRFYLSLFPELPNPGFAQVVVRTASVEDREAVRHRLLALFDADEAFPELRARVTRFEFGPPVGFPVQFRVIGPDLDIVRNIAYAARDLVRQSALVRDTQLDWHEQVRTLRVAVDQDKARMLGVTSADVSAVTQMVLSGLPVTQLRRGEELVDVVLRAEPDEREGLERLGDVQLFTRQGTVLPLSQVATIESAFEEPVLWRRNRDVVVTVSSDVVDGVQGPSATRAIWPSLQPLLDALPPGYRIEQGGAIEESDKSNRALFAVFPLMFAVMLAILMAQLQSFPRMLIVFMTAPLGLVGAVPALLLFNQPFGFVALLGVIALGGMIMRNSVILVDQIDRELAGGATLGAAAIEATVRRARPVLLTAAAAVLAMLPLSGSVFWGPMAIAIMGGLIAGTALTLSFVPVLYLSWFKFERMRRRARVQAGRVPREWAPTLKVE